MSSFKLIPGDEYDKQCGEVFLTVDGNIIFHCSLCEEKYRGIKEYAVHVIEKHYNPSILNDDCISTHSSDLFEEVENSFYKDKVKEELDIALQEEEIPISIATEKKHFIPVVTAVPVVDECDPDSMTFKWEEAPFINTEYKRKKLRPRVLPQKIISPKQPTRKPLTESEKIRMANEEARCLELPTFKQPVARGNFPDSERKHKCNFCGFSFKDPSNLIAHIKRHANKRTFQCAYCSKMFCTRTEIEEHSRRHTNEKPFLCNYANCDKAYFTRSELNMHIKRHLNQRDHKCQECGRAFFDKSDLREHMVSHTQERNHECLICNGRFSRRKSLVNHMKLHENKREYQCKLCDASFNQKPGLSSHMKNKHKEKYQ